MKGNLILIHGGGPTAVINASLAGAIRQAKKEPNVDRILAAIGGVDLVWFAFPLAELLGTVYFAIALKHLYRTEIRRLDILAETSY